MLVAGIDFHTCGGRSFLSLFGLVWDFRYVAERRDSAPSERGVRRLRRWILKYSGFRKAGESQTSQTFLNLPQLRSWGNLGITSNGDLVPADVPVSLDGDKCIIACGWLRVFCSQIDEAKRFTRHFSSFYS